MTAARRKVLNTGHLDRIARVSRQRILVPNVELRKRNENGITRIRRTVDGRKCTARLALDSTARIGRRAQRVRSRVSQITSDRQNVSRHSSERIFRIAIRVRNGRRAARRRDARRIRGPYSVVSARDRI